MCALDIFIVLLMFLITLAVFMMIFELSKQDRFEKEITEEWDNMTQEEKIASGRENKYC